MRDHRVPGSLLDLLIQEETIMEKLGDIQTEVAKAEKRLENLSECETILRNYCIERLDEHTRELDRLEQDLEQVRARIGDYIRYRGILKNGGINNDHS